MRILFAYGFAPSGHASAAKALEARARAAGHDTSCLDITADYHRILGPAINNIYLTLIQSFPNFWATIHDSEDAAAVLSKWRNVYHLFEGSRLRETVHELKPDRIVCTHAGPFAALTLAREKGEVPSKLVGVVTDFRPHPYWAVPGADLYVTATDDGADLLAARGIPREKLLAAGIPIHPAFDEALPEPRRNGKPRVLISGGSRGLGRIWEAATALRDGLPGVEIVVVCGANEPLRESLASEPGLMVHGSVSAAEMRRLMAESDLLIGKAGGLTSAECLALGVPMVVLDPIAGQEQSNTEFLAAAGAGVPAGEPKDLPGLVGSLLAPERLRAMREKAAALGKRGAAARILDAIVS